MPDPIEQASVSQSEHSGAAGAGPGSFASGADLAAARKHEEPLSTDAEANIAKALADTFSDEPKEDDDLIRKGAEALAPKTQKAPSTASAATSEKPSAQTESKEPESTSSTTESHTSGPSLDPVLVRSLKRKGYTDEEIASEHAEDPKSFERLAKYIHREAQQEDARAAQVASQQQPYRPLPPAPQVHVPPPVVAQPGLPNFDLAALREQYKTPDGKTHPIVEMLAAQHQQLQSMIPQVQAAQQFAVKQEQESIVRMIDSVFADPANAPVHAILGKDRASLTPEQAEERRKVVASADALYSGYQGMGRPISQAEALQRSIDMHASQNARASAREEIKSDLAKRAAATTLKPGASRASSGAKEKSKPQTELELRDRVRGKMKEIGLHV